MPLDLTAAREAHEQAAAALDAAKAACTDCGGDGDVPTALEPDDSGEVPDVQDQHRFGAVHLAHATDLEAAYANFRRSSYQLKAAEQAAGVSGASSGAVAQVTVSTEGGQQ